MGAFSFSCVILLCILQYISTFEYQKNQKIKLREKGKAGHVSQMEQIDDLLNLINSTTFPKNLMIAFTTERCINCEELISTLETVSEFIFTQQAFEFAKVDCMRNKAICDHFNIKLYPTIKVFLKDLSTGLLKETNSVPNGKDLESLLEYVDKVYSPDIIPLTSTKELNNFSKQFGDVSFLLIDNGDQEIRECFEKLAGDARYKPVFFFGVMKKEKFRNDLQIKIPAVVLTGINSEFNIHISISSDDFNCTQIENFIEENKYPIIKKLDQNYIARLHRENKILIFITIDKQDSSHVSFLNNFFHNVAISRRDLVFSYIDIQEDSSLLRFFNVRDVSELNIVIYDFSKGKFFIEKHPEGLMKIKELLDKLNSNEINWKTGYYLEDFISGLGVNISRQNLSIIFVCFISFILVSLVLFICRALDKDLQTEKKTK